jgi:hypothetical protein
MAKQKKLKAEYLEGEIQIDWRIAFGAFRDLARAMNDEINLIGEDAELRNTYSPKTLAKMCWTTRYYTDAMRAVRLKCEGKSSREIAAEMDKSVRQVGSFIAWNTIRGKELDQELKNLGTTKEDRQAYESFLAEIGISVKKSATGVKRGR